MNTERNKELLRREQEEFWGQGKYDLAKEIFAPQITEGDGREVSPDDLIGLNQMQHGAAPDVRIRVSDLVAEGDRVVGRLEITGTQKGEWMGIPATGRRFTMTGMVMRRIENGKIAERWDNIDWWSGIQQLGAAPGMAVNQDNYIDATKGKEF
jgi:predicted ester cyclase